MRTAGNVVFVNGIVSSVHGKFYPERNESFLKSEENSDVICAVSGTGMRISLTAGSPFSITMLKYIS